MNNHDLDADQQLAAVARSISEVMRGTRRTIVAAESVTAGNIATTLAAAPDASEWFRGSIVSYQTAMKRQVLDVVSEKIITPQCAKEMAQGALRLTAADLVVAVTGVGGPDPEEDQPAGTVYICAGDKEQLREFAYRFDGDPETVVRLATLCSLQHLRGAAPPLR